MRCDKIIKETYGTNYSSMDQVKFVKDSLWKIWKDISSALGRPYPFNIFKGCLQQILLGLLLNTLSHIDPQLPNLQSIIKLSNASMLELPFAAQKMRFPIKNLFFKQFLADLVTFTEEILNRKLHFFWSGC